MKGQVNQMIPHYIESAKTIIKEKGYKKNRPVMACPGFSNSYIITRGYKDISNPLTHSQVDIFLYRGLVVILKGIIQGIKINKSRNDGN